MKKLPSAVVCPILGFALAACGSSQSHADAPTGTEQQDGEGTSCLDAASAPRTPRVNAPAKIAISHVLVRHVDLERPQGAARSRQAACLYALEARAALHEGSEWNSVVDEFSDSGKSTHGDLGTVGRDELSKRFGDAAFTLDVDELSYVVESDRGFHIILRTE